MPSIFIQTVTIMVAELLTFFILCCTFQFCEGQQIKTQLFEKFTEVSDTVCYGNTYISSSNGVSICQCSDKCVSNRECQAFFYNKNASRLCVLHDTVITDFSSCIEGNGMNYYVPDDFVPTTTTENIQSTTDIIETTKNIPRTTVTLTPSCDVGWQLIGSGCYLFTPGGMTWWETAQGICISKGGYLAEILTLEENDSLKTAAAAQEGGGGGDHFIGGNDLANEGTFVWDGFGTPITGFQDWYPGQPDNGGSAADQHCIMLQSSFQYVWNDVKCNVNRKFICEMDPIYI